MSKLAEMSVDEFRKQSIEALMKAYTGVCGPTNLFTRARCSNLVDYILGQFDLELSEAGKRDSEYLREVYKEAFCKKHETTYSTKWWHRLFGSHQNNAR